MSVVTKELAIKIRTATEDLIKSIETDTRVFKEVNGAYDRLKAATPPWQWPEFFVGAVVATVVLLLIAVIVPHH
jgi:hypothetical protein